MAFVVIARWTAREGEAGAVRAAIEKLVEPSRAEAGCRFYQPTVDPGNPHVFVLVEIYDDEAAYRAHGESEHFQRHGVGDGIPRLESRERAFYETFS